MASLIILNLAKAIEFFVDNQFFIIHINFNWLMVFTLKHRVTIGYHKLALMAVWIPNFGATCSLNHVYQPVYLPVVRAIEAWLSLGWSTRGRMDSRCLVIGSPIVQFFFAQKWNPTPKWIVSSDKLLRWNHLIKSGWPIGCWLTVLAAPNHEILPLLKETEDEQSGFRTSK